MKILRALTAISAALLSSFAASAAFASSETIDFGANLPAGPVPAGYAGFNWGTGVNQAINSGPDAEIFFLTNPAASMVQFGQAGLFDLNSVDYQVLMSGITAEDTFNNYTTVVSGYRGGTLVASVTENYPGTGGNQFNNLNIDGVDQVTFSTTDTSGFLDSLGNMIVTGMSAAATFVDELTVTPAVTVAPEIDTASAASALTLLLGGLMVLRGRRRAD